jgi:hypothetical protein
MFTLKSIFVKNKNKNYYYYFPILPKFTIRNVNRICLYTEPQEGPRTRDSVICCEASFAFYDTYIADPLGRCYRQLRPIRGGNEVPVGELAPVPAENVEHVHQRPAVRPRANRRRAPVEQEPVNEQNVIVILTILSN